MNLEFHPGLGCLITHDYYSTYSLKLTATQFLETTSEYQLMLRDHAQNTTNVAISLVVNNVIPLLSGPPT